MSTSFQRVARKTTQVVDPIAKREETTKRAREMRGRDVPPFLLCARVSKLAPEKVMPWYEKDACRGCGTPVWFDPQYAPRSTPHVCMVCANGASKSLRIDGLDDSPIDENNLNDQEQYARIMKSVSERENREHLIQGINQ